MMDIGTWKMRKCKFANSIPQEQKKNLHETHSGWLSVHLNGFAHILEYDFNRITLAHILSLLFKVLASQPDCNVHMPKIPRKKKLILIQNYLNMHIQMRYENRLNFQNVHLFSPFFSNSSWAACIMQSSWASQAKFYELCSSLPHPPRLYFVYSGGRLNMHNTQHMDNIQGRRYGIPGFSRRLENFAQYNRKKKLGSERIASDRDNENWIIKFYGFN